MEGKVQIVIAAIFGIITGLILLIPLVTIFGIGITDYIISKYGIIIVIIFTIIWFLILKKRPNIWPLQGTIPRKKG